MSRVLALTKVFRQVSSIDKEKALESINAMQMILEVLKVNNMENI
jgi:hypothetical protein